MSWRVVGNLSQVEDWLINGLGRHIVVYDDALKICWEGFVNQVDGSVGGLSETHGPLIDVGNKICIVYSPLFPDIAQGVDWTPIAGIRSYTSWASDTASQAKWGIQYKVISGGSVTELEAEYIRATWLADNAEPRTSQQYGGGNELGVTIQCLGYWHLANWPYLQILVPGRIDTSNPAGTGKMQLILASSPNAIFSTDYTNMVANTMLVEAWESNDNLANSLLKSLTAAGNMTADAYTCGIYADRKCHYAMVPTDTTYHQYLSDPAGKITTPLGVEVKPWNVSPGKWLFYPDHYVGRTIPSNRRLDARFEFIESVTYNSESTPAVSHSGGKIEKLPQILARWGLQGG